MARYTGPKHKLSRRAGIDLFGTGGPSLKRRLATPPGQHGAGGRRKKKLSEYGLQLQEKQKAKQMYGVLERQFRRYFEEATRARGATGEALLQILERRLDNAVYRLGFARTRPMARQLVTHGHVYVNEKRVNIPSIQVKPGDVIRLSETAAQMPSIQELLQEAPEVPAWLERTGTTGRVLRPPAPEEMERRLNLALIVEYYSR
ncbi:MAG: 30S ribosomal protein S4 [Chloroflexi bacterium]|nr:30S ribosomal protein S4 [Chloroflexota bacterium]MDA8187683.1 30S ribosomal protein S4 [Dehalococcoidales bacterium]